MQAFDPITERCLDWVIDRVRYDEELSISLSRRVWDFGEHARREATCTFAFKNVQSFAHVDGAFLEQYNDTGDAPPLLKEFSCDGVTTHIPDLRVSGDHRDIGLRRFRITAGDDAAEVITRGARTLACFTKPIPWGTD